MSALIRSPRLDLIVISPELLDAIITADKVSAHLLAPAHLPDELFPATPDAVDFLRMRRREVQTNLAWAPWSLRAVVLREENTVIGTANFHGPPGVNATATPDAAEMGYEIFPAHRGVGFATEVAMALLTWANRAHGVRHFVSAVGPDNAASLHINQKLGFAPTGEVVDGEIIFDLHLGNNEDLWARVATARSGRRARAAGGDAAEQDVDEVSRKLGPVEPR